MKRSKRSSVYARHLAILAAVFCTAAVAADQRPEAPSDGCLDARAVVLARQVDPQRLLVDAGQGRFALKTADSCPMSATTVEALLSPHGWVCGGRPDVEFVRVQGKLCPVREVEPLSARAFAAELRRADRMLSAGSTPSLARVEVHARAPDRRRFLRSTAYCFDPRWVRGWRTDGKDMLVDTSAKRSGGNSLYRVELGRSCPELELSQAVTFHSGIGGAICGNAGDHAKVIRGLPPEFTAGGVLSAQASTGGCPITAVYPVRSPGES